MKKATIMGYAFEVDGIYYVINDDGKTVYVTSGNVEYSGAVVIPSTVTYDGTTYSVTEIGEEAFAGCSGLRSVTIPESVTKIGVQAFFYCRGLTSITIPESVTSIGNYAFDSCTGLTSVTIPESVTEIGVWAFEGCSGLTKVVYNAENCTSMGSRDFPVFSGCTKITSLKIGENVKTIPSYAFQGCSGLASVTIPESVTKIGDYAFRSCRVLTSVTIPESVTTIGNYAFESCSGLTSVTIPESVTSIGIGAFFNCSGLTSVTIPESVTEIGDWAFKDCTELMSFTSLNVTPPTLPDETTFEGMSGSCQLYVPKSSVLAYKTSTGWTFFTYLNVIPDSGVDAIETDTLTVTVDGGAIRVDGAEGAVIEVYSLGGMLLYRGTETTIAMQSGAYLVKVAGTTQKVVL